MPSTKKTLHFMSSALFTAVSVGILGFGMSAQWAKTSMRCARGGTDLFNGSATVTVELFDGNLDREFCPLFGRPVDFQVFPKLLESNTVSAVLHVLSLGLLVLCLVFNACSILISLYNSVSNPYETYMGPIGVYTCSSLSTCLSAVVLILFVANVYGTSMAEDLVKTFAGSTSVDLSNPSARMEIGYYLLIPYMALNLLAIALIYAYDHAAYTHRREQQRPTEDAPKEIMMY